MSTIQIPSDIYMTISLFIPGTRTLLSLSSVQKNARQIRNLHKNELFKNNINIMNFDKLLFFRNVNNSISHSESFLEKTLSIIDSSNFTKTFTIVQMNKVVAKFSIKQLKAINHINNIKVISVMYLVLVDDYVQNKQFIGDNFFSAEYDIIADDFYLMALEYVQLILSQFQEHHVISGQFDYQVNPSSQDEVKDREPVIYDTCEKIRHRNIYNETCERISHHNMYDENSYLHKRAINKFIEYNEHTCFYY
jgi:hypothetical protein